MLGRHDIDADAAEGQQPQEKTVGKADTAFLPDEMRLLLSGQLLVHQDPDRDRQRLGADVAGHIQNQRLEDHHDRQLRHNRLEEADHAGDDHAESQKEDQPGKTLLHALLQRLVQILLSGQTA